MLANESLESERTRFQIVVQVYFRVLLNEIVKMRKVNFELIRSSKLGNYLLELLLFIIGRGSLG